MSLYFGVFLVSFTVLVLEVSLSRLLSVVTWYHLAFFAVSTAMLGMTAGSTFVYLRPERLGRDDLARFSLGFAAAIPVALTLLCLIPLELSPTLTSLLALFVATAVCALPFYFSGIVITSVMTQLTLPISRLYATDLTGASLGCLFVLAGLRLLDATSLILFCSALAIVAAIAFGWSTWPPSKRVAGIAGTLVVGLLAFANAATPHGLRPLVVKGFVERFEDYLFERWNSFSRVVVYREHQDVPQYWGPSPKAPQEPLLPQYNMKIDGAAGTMLRPFRTPEDLEHLRYDVVNVAYYLRPRGGAVIIGVGGGRDLQSALAFGHERIVGIDVNPIFIDLLEGPFREFAGLAGRPEIQLVADEARSYLTRSTERFALMQMSLIDTWASTGAGAFSLSENALYTVEAWQVFLARLAPDGIFTVSRWYSPGYLGETGRLVSLAVASLYQYGIEKPADHLAMVSAGNVSTLLVSAAPFTAQDIANLKEVAGRLEYPILFLPGQAPPDEALDRILSAVSVEDLLAKVADLPFNYVPPTDESPYFFNMLRLRHAGRVFQASVGVLRGNLVATLTLLALIVSLSTLACLTVLLPLFRAARAEPTSGGGAPSWAAAAYFSLIGCGFMLVEIGLVQRLSVLLGHPVYALGILLFTIIASTGLGSFFSERLPTDRRSVLAVLPIAAAVLLLAAPTVLSAVAASTITSPIETRIAASIAVNFPIGLVLGQFLPVGMRIVRENRGETPWYWALNGVFGVLCSALAVMISIYASISTNFFLGAGCYIAGGALLPRLRSARVKTA